mgnify:FL=1
MEVSHHHLVVSLFEISLLLFINYLITKGSSDGFLTKYAPGSCDEEFFEILSKFKLAFNLLAKLNGCIHDPNAPELVHFLFTPVSRDSDVIN